MPNKAENRYYPWLVRGLHLLILTGGLTAWELHARRERTFQFFFSRPIRILTRVWEWMTDGEIYGHALVTLKETLLGFAIGVAGGLVLALACYYAPLIHRLIRPYMEIATSIPRVVLGPLFILWFGLDMASKVALAASLVLFIVFFTTLAGLDEVDNNVVYKVRLFGASRWHLLIHVLLPSALTWVFSSLKSSVGFALAGAVVGEYIGSGRGLGYRIALAEGNLDSTGIYAGLLVLAALVLCLNALLEYAERRLSPWKTSS